MRNKLIHLMVIFVMLKCYKLLYYKEILSIYWMTLVFESNQVTNDLVVLAINVRGQGAAISTTVFLSIHQKKILLILGK